MMEKIMERANAALDIALEKRSYIPQHVWENCKGVGIITVSEKGFVFSLQEGDGIVISKKNQNDNVYNENKEGITTSTSTTTSTTPYNIEWEQPKPIIFTGTSAGLIFGKATKHIFLFPMTKRGLDNLYGKTTYQLGVQAGIVMGPLSGSDNIGGELSTGTEIGSKGIDLTFSYVLQEGMFVNIGINNYMIDTAINDNIKKDPISGIERYGPGLQPEGKSVILLHNKLNELCTV